MTIRMLADQVDWHRYQAGPTGQSVQQALAEPKVPTITAIGQPEHRLWQNDDEEEVYAAFESGDMTQEAAAAALQAIGALSTEVTLDRG